MQSTYLSRSLFRCTRISFITAALFVGTLALAGNAAAQEPTSSQRPVPESPAMAEHNAAPAEARYRVGQGNQQDVLKAQLQHRLRRSRSLRQCH